MDTWYGLVAPAGTPGSIVKKLNQEFARAARDPEVIRKMELLGVGQRSTNPTEFAALIARDTARMGKIIKDAGIRPN
jgi:tripartite-type tricarboxylate transporter receptor subunit TctC